MYLDNSTLIFFNFGHGLVHALYFSVHTAITSIQVPIPIGKTPYKKPPLYIEVPVGSHDQLILYDNNIYHATGNKLIKLTKFGERVRVNHPGSVLQHGQPLTGHTIRYK